ncbi:hypothetical protein DOY81_012163 [Sarcophaga bullata]|nr:hypothetical protein DOY81_012163 [Sarcophaga bullata]
MRINFWIECFRLIKRVIDHVDYKGVREIMKACRDKAQRFPLNVNVTYLPQLNFIIMTDVVEEFRSNCPNGVHVLDHTHMLPLLNIRLCRSYDESLELVSHTLNSISRSLPYEREL